MTWFAVTRDAGPGWTEGMNAFEQPGAADHAAFMNELAADGLVLFAGPLAGTEQGRLRVLLIAQASSPDDIHHRLADDPWVHAQRLVTTSIEPWALFVGADRIPTAP